MSDAEQPEKRPVRGRHYDWDAIRTTYVEGTTRNGEVTWPTLDEAAEAHGAQPVRVREKSADEGWVELRAAFQRRVAEERQTARSTELARLGADFDLAALRTARAGLTLTASKLHEVARIQAARDSLAAFDQEHPGVLTPDEERTRGALIEQATGYVDANDLARLGLSAQRWFALGKAALGDEATQGIRILPPTRPIEVEHHHSVEARDTRTGEIILALVEAGELDEGVAHALGLDPELPALQAAAFVEGAGEDADTAGGLDDT